MSPLTGHCKSLHYKRRHGGGILMRQHHQHSQRLRKTNTHTLQPFVFSLWSQGCLALSRSICQNCKRNLIIQGELFLCCRNLYATWIYHTYIFTRLYRHWNIICPLSKYQPELDLEESLKGYEHRWLNSLLTYNLTAKLAFINILGEDTLSGEYLSNGTFMLILVLNLINGICGFCMAQLTYWRSTSMKYKFNECDVGNSI